MTTVEDIGKWMEGVAPLELSESWDNTGLLLGDPGGQVERLLTCLTLTPDSVREATELEADMVITHHPLPFKPLSKITTHSQSGKLVWQLARAGISVYSPHTAWDSAPLGINALLAQKLQLSNCQPLVDSQRPECVGLGAGRIGDLSHPATVASLVSNVRQLIPETLPRGFDSGLPVTRIAIACGSGGSLLAAGVELNCDLFLTGEATFHTCLEAEAYGVALLMIGHFASERFAMQHLAGLLQHDFPTLQVWASNYEKDPVTSFL